MTMKTSSTGRLATERVIVCPLLAYCVEKLRFLPPSILGARHSRILTARQSPGDSESHSRRRDELEIGAPFLPSEFFNTIGRKQTLQLRSAPAQWAALTGIDGQLNRNPHQLAKNRQHVLLRVIPVETVHYYGGVLVRGLALPIGVLTSAPGCKPLK
jgi:hypothetical protein